MNSILDLLELEHADTNVFIGPVSNDPHVRTFGGQFVAQALMAAGLTVAKNRSPISLMSVFLNPGTPTEPTEYRVTISRDGGTTSHRRVEGFQKDKLIYEQIAMFQSAQSGFTHSVAAPEVPRPETLETFDKRFAGRDKIDMLRWFNRTDSFDVRYVDTTPFEANEAGREPTQQVWVKSKIILPDRDLTHAAVFAYISDLTILDPALLRHGIKWTDADILGASLDHQIAFSQSFRMDQWVLLDESSPIAAGGRTLLNAQAWTETGRLVAGVSQQALVRLPGMGLGA